MCPRQLRASRDSQSRFSACDRNRITIAREQHKMCGQDSVFFWRKHCKSSLLPESARKAPSDHCGLRLTRTIYGTHLRGVHLRRPLPSGHGSVKRTGSGERPGRPPRRVPRKTVKRTGIARNEQDPLKELDPSGGAATAPGSPCTREAVKLAAPGVSRVGQQCRSSTWATPTPQWRENLKEVCRWCRAEVERTVRPS